MDLDPKDSHLNLVDSTTSLECITHNIQVRKKIKSHLHMAQQNSLCIQVDYSKTVSNLLKVQTGDLDAISLCHVLATF